MRGNSMLRNGQLGIELDDILFENPNDPGDPDVGRNRLQNTPELVDVTFVGNQVTGSYSVSTDPVNATYPLADRLLHRGTSIPSRARPTSATTIYSTTDFATGEVSQVFTAVAPLANGAGRHRDCHRFRGQHIGVHRDRDHGDAGARCAGLQVAAVAAARVAPPLLIRCDGRQRAASYRRAVFEVAKIVALAVAAACAYGVAQDQLTARLSLEYFSLAHPKLIASQRTGAARDSRGASRRPGGSAPRSACCWPSRRRPDRAQPGTLLRCCGRSRSCWSRPRSARPPSASWDGSAPHNGVLQLRDPLATAIPDSRHARFFGAWGATAGAYASGTLGALVLGIAVWRERGRASRETGA